MKTEIIKENLKKIFILHILTIFAISILLTLFLTLILIPFNLVLANYLNIIFIAFVIMTMLLLIYSYFIVIKKTYNYKNRDLKIIFSVIILSTIISLLTMKYISVYAIPLVATTILIAVLIGKNVAIIVTVFNAFMVYLVDSVLTNIIIDAESLSVTSFVGLILSIISGVYVVLLVQKNYTRFKLIWGSLAIGVAVSILSLLLFLLSGDSVILALKNAGYFLIGNCIGVILYCLMLPIYEVIFNVWTNFKLAEICSVSNPLLRKLAEEAPGTFNHSLIVSNIVESCAVSIGENPYLAKACALYHDIGKLSNPTFFVENQKNGHNPHDDLIPELSVNMITSHASYGYQLLKENRMPEEICRTALEHHGNSVVHYFYRKAQEITDGNLSTENYRYTTPKPTNKISAIVMMADTLEAAYRANSPATEKELDLFINNIVKSKMDDSQFSDCNITFLDIRLIKETVKKVLPSINHERIKYQK